MYTFLLVLLILDALILIAAILLQSGKGGGLAANFGGAGSSSDSVMGTRQAGNLLTKASWWCGGAFLGLAFILQLMSTRSVAPKSVLDKLAAPAPTAPAPKSANTAAPVAPLTTQRVPHYCVEGWTALAEFTGVRVSELAKAAGARVDAGYVDFASFDDGYHESWDRESADHPQALVVIAKDGEPLSARYGAPARVHAPVKLGYKNTKYLTRVVFMPQRNGGYWSDIGYEWYGGT